MANKQINQLNSKTGILGESDYLIIYDSSETGSEKTKKVAISDYTKVIDSAFTLYVSTTGSDSTGDGTSGSPWATIGKAIDWLGPKIIGSNGFVTIQLADGTYNSQSTVTFRHPYGARIAIVGNETTPANVTLNYINSQKGFYILNNAFLRLKGLKLVGNAKETDAIAAVYSGSFLITNCVLDNWSRGVQLYVNAAGSIEYSTINNCANDGVFCNAVSSCYVRNSTISNNNYGLNAGRLSNIYAYSCSFSGNSSNTYSSNSGRVVTE